MIGEKRKINMIPKFRYHDAGLKVIAAIPCYNNAKTIADVVSRTLKYVDEVIVIDDGSKDKTAELAKAAGARVISHDKNLGKGAAMKTVAANSESDIIIFIDGDGQHNPDDIPKLLEPILNGKADYVIGSRYLDESKLSSNPFIRKAANSVASFIISFIISVLQPVARFVTHQQLPIKATKCQPVILEPSEGHRGEEDSRTKAQSSLPKYRVLHGRFKWINDCTSGFTAMRKGNWQKLNLISDGFEIETEMIFEQAKNGFVIAETPISCKWGESASKLSITKDALRTLKLLLKKTLYYS